MQACLGMCYVGTLATPSAIWEFDPRVQKIHIHLLRKTLVSKSDQKWSLIHGTILEDHPSTILMS